MDAPRPAHEALSGVTPQRLAASLAGSLGVFVLMFLAAGSVRWSAGWLLVVVLTLASLAGFWYLRRANPEVIAARLQPHQGTKSWDKVWLTVAVPAMLLVPIVAAVDAGRFHWTAAPPWAVVCGYAAVLAGIVIVTWAESVNRFFEPTVRIQSDRGHHVVDTGPYRYVRHPGYAGAILLVVGLPPALGSLAGLYASALVVGLFLVRTTLEDRMLQRELAGYAAYAARVRYRILPGVW